jgi:LuxR family maltose regulon positive regulatory protein
MSKQSLHTLIWSPQHYEFQTRGQPVQRFHPGEEAAFTRFLQDYTSFAFVGQDGRLSVRKEARTAANRYWYAYRKKAGQTCKRYLGATPQLTFARLEEVARDLSNSSSPAFIPQPAEPDELLLTSKCAPCRLPLSLVKRTRLLDDLEAVINHPLTLLSAPAGFGKTTLLSAWLTANALPGARVHRVKEGEVAVAWLSLEELDNDPVRFGISCITALRTCLPTVGEKTLAVLHAQEMLPLSSILTPLLAEIEQVHREVILILDDYHVISEQIIIESMRFFLDHMPANLHLVLATRTDPELPLSRLRMRGQLLEIRDHDLRFTKAEASRFLLEGMGLPLKEEEVATLQRRTEGWIAGLQLAALAARKREDLSLFVQDFAGSHRFVLDFVQQDILASLPSPLQNFMLQTSILTCMNARLCQAVTAIPEYLPCQQHLLTLERANLFLVSLDDERQWYRYHDLFREALLAQLHASQPELVPLLHLRAARFFEAAGQRREAISHALAAPDYAYAASLMEQMAPSLWLNGETRTVHNWIVALPDAVLRAHLRLALNAALRFLNSFNLSNKTLYATMRIELERTFTNMERLVHRKSELSLSDAEVALIQRRLFLLRALMEARSLLKLGDIERMQHLVEESEALLPDEEEHWSIIPLLLTVWLTVNLKGEGASLIPRLLTVRQQMIEARNNQAVIRVMTWLALASSQAARWHLAYQEARHALTLLEQSGGRTIVAGYLYACLFNACYAWNRLEEAADWLLRFTQCAQDWQVVELLVKGQVFSVRLALARGDLSTAQHALNQLESLVHQEGFANHTVDLNLLHVQIWLAEGRLDQIRLWAAQTTFEDATLNPLHRGELLMLVRVLLEQHQYAQAEEMLSRFSQHFDKKEEVSAALEWMTLSVIALCHAGKKEQAEHVMARMLTLTEPENSIRIYLDAGPLMKQALKMLNRAPRTAGSGAVAISLSSITRILSAFEQSAPLAGRFKEQQQASGHDTNLALLEPLSAQELRVLRLLVSGQTYSEMASTLIVSPNTIKTQISSIYRKLGVSRRAQAIARTQQLHLL